MKKTLKLSIMPAMVLLALSALPLVSCGGGTTPAGHVHQWGEWTQTKAPTETAEGEETRTCALDPSHKETRAIAKLEHAHQWGEWEQTIAPTQTEDGEETRTCAICGETVTRPIAAFNHTHDWGEWEVTTPAACTAAGEETRVCTLNADHYDTRAISALGHDWGEWEQTIAPTETEDGEETRTCAVCGETETNAIAALNHEHIWSDDWEVITPATCTAPGEKTRVCTLNENHKDYGEIEIAPAAHNYNWTLKTAPTCTKPGEDTGTCSHNPSHTTIRYTATDPDAHDYQWTEIKAPTCSAVGTESGVCKHDNSHTATHDKPINSAAHDYQWTETTPATLTAEGVETEICSHDASHKRGTRPIAMLTIPPYIITVSGTAFTATRDGALVGTAGQPIQTVIDGIRTDADGEECTIQFGNLTDTLDIGTATATFSGAWGEITLTGKITGNVNTATTGTIVIADAVSITSTADIANTGGTDGRAVYHNSTGAVNISGGTVSGGTGRAIHNKTTGTINISGGTVSATTGQAVYNDSSGVYNDSYGKITVSGTALVTSENTTISSGTVVVGGGIIEMTGGRVENTSTTTSSSNAVSITGPGLGAEGYANISGGTISAIAGVAVRGQFSIITVSGTALITSANTNVSTSSLTNSGTIVIAHGEDFNGYEPLKITGGTVQNTSTTTGNVVAFKQIGGEFTMTDGSVLATGTEVNAIFFGNGGERLTISGGTVSATGASGYSIYKAGYGFVTVTSPPTVIDKDKTYGDITWLP